MICKRIGQVNYSTISDNELCSAFLIDEHLLICHVLAKIIPPQGTPLSPFSFRYPSSGLLIGLCDKFSYSTDYTIVKLLMHTVLFQ
jgi:hypothetical protein